MYQRALELRSETVAHRRFFHQIAEVGLDLPRSMEYVTKTLRQCGLTPRACGHGVICDLGRGEKRLLLRADLDALPMKEESGLPFACTTGHAHACGHDCHSAMLLTAAKLLKEREADLQGTVRLLFQPAEECLTGAKEMLCAGALEPMPHGALAFHVAAGRTPPGICFCPTGREPMMLSADNFRITIRGKGGHGACPHLAVDPIHIGVHIHLALQSLVARECDPEKTCVLSVGRFSAGTAANILPDTAVLQGTIRAKDPETGQKLVRRLETVCRQMAELFGGSAEVEWTGQVPALRCDPELIRDMTGYLQELPLPQVRFGASGSASEDFAWIADRVPAMFAYLSAGFDDERGDALAHDPGVLFHEDVLPIGAAAYAHCALRWLETHR